VCKERIKPVAQIIGPDISQEKWVEVLYFTWTGLESVHAFSTDIGQMVLMCLWKEERQWTQDATRGKLWLNIRKKKFTVTLVIHWIMFSSEAVETPSLNKFRHQLNIALKNLIWLKCIWCWIWPC